MSPHFFILFLGVAFLASGGIFVKLSELGPIATAFYRILLAMPLALAWGQWASSPRRRHSAATFPRGDFALMLGSGAFLALDLILWHVSFHHTTVANANLLANLVPFVVVPVSWLLFKEHVSRLFLLGLCVAIAGVLTLMSGKISPTPDNFFGDFLAMATAVFYGFYFLTVGRLRARYNAGEILFWGGFSSLVILFTAAAFWEKQLIPATAQGWALLLCLAAFSQIGGQGLVAMSLGRLSIAFSSVAVLTQPVIAAGYALLIFSETPSAMEMVGAAIVMLGIYVAKIGSASFHEKCGRKMIEKKIRDMRKCGALHVFWKPPNELVECLLEDLDVACKRNPAASPLSVIVSDSPGFHAICAYRLANFLLTKGGKIPTLVAFKIYERAFERTGIDIHPRAQIGRRIVIDHGRGIVVGETCKIGDDCYMLGGAVLGSRSIGENSSGKRHPDIGNRVQIGMNARILGPIKIGDDVFIAPHAVVTEGVSSRSKVVVVNQIQVIKQPADAGGMPRSDGKEELHRRKRGGGSE